MQHYETPQALYINPSMSVIVKDPDYIERRPNFTFETNFEDNKTNGKISDNARKRLYSAIEWLLLLAKEKTLRGKFRYKVSMITLTLPCIQLQDDTYVKNSMLNTFLTELRRRFNLKNYIWRAEKQNDGSIHFHILQDQYIEYFEINKIWNKILLNHGYIEQYRLNQLNFHKNGFRVRADLIKKGWTIDKQKKAYEFGMRTNWQNPTGTTDIHSLKKIRNVKAYCAKYLSKNESKGQVVEGRLWFISRSLSGLKSIKVSIDDFVRNDLERIVKTDKIKYTDHACLIFHRIDEFIGSGYSAIKQRIYEGIEQIRNNIGQFWSLFDQPPVNQYLELKNL